MGRSTGKRSIGWPAATALLLACVLGTGATAQDSLDAVLEEARRALGGGARASGLALGEAEYRETAGAFRLSFDEHGAFELAVDGRLGYRVGHDGEEVWRVEERTGVPFPLDLWLGDVERAWMAVWTGAWAGEGFSFELARDERQDTEDEVALTLRSPRSSYHATLFLDRRTHLARRLVSDEGWSGRNAWELEDHAEVADGFWMARSVVLTDYGGLHDSYYLRSVTPGDRAVSTGARPPDEPRNFVYDTSTSPEVEVRHAANGLLLVRPTVDGEDVGWFIFDTGAPFSVIEESAAERLGLAAFGAGIQAGAGPGVAATVLCQSESLELGPLRLERPVFTQMSLGLETGTEPAVAAGVIGWDVLIHTVAELDLFAPSLTLRNPEDDRLAIGDWQELVLHLGHPHFRARFAHGEGLFRFDTGAGRFGVMFHSPAVKELELLADRKTSYGEGVGAGGRSRFRFGRIDWFEVAGHRVLRPRVAFCLDESGALADPNALGNLGAGFFEPFVVVLDYRRERVAFVPKR